VKNVLCDPRAGGAPTDLGSPRAWRHVCSSRWVVVFHWAATDPALPEDVVRVERLVPRL
jgi:hypothetical protein